MLDTCTGHCSFVFYTKKASRPRSLLLCLLTLPVQPIPYIFRKSAYISDIIVIINIDITIINNIVIMLFTTVTGIKIKTTVDSICMHVLLISFA